MKKILIILSCLIFLTGCNNKTEDASSKEKLTAEMEYISLEIADLLHNLNNISLENYEVVTEKVSLSKESSSQSEGQSSGGGSSGGGQNGGSSQSGSGEQSGQSGQESSQSKQGDKENISVTEMQNKSILNTDTKKLEWDKMKQDIEAINTSWSVMMIDLKNNNVSEDSITEFSNTLNSTIISIKNEDKKATLTNLTNLYSYIPKFLTSISADQNTQVLETTKYHVFLAYSAASQENWDTATTNLEAAESNFLNILNDEEYKDNKKFKSTKTHTLIKDLKNSIFNKDKDLFFLKYKNLIESLNTF